MNFSLDALEYHRLKDLLERYVSTDAGREKLGDLEPIVDEQKLESEHAITSEAMSYLREHRVPFNDIPLLSPALEKLTIAGATLEIPEIEAIRHFFLTWRGFGFDGEKNEKSSRSFRKPASVFPI